MGESFSIPDAPRRGVDEMETSCFGVPKKNNPNLFSVGDGFGLFVFLGEFEEMHFRNGVAKQPESEPRETRKKKQI